MSYTEQISTLQLTPSQSLLHSPAELEADDKRGRTLNGSGWGPLATKMCFQPGVILATRPQAEAWRCLSFRIVRLKWSDEGEATGTLTGRFSLLLISKSLLKDL